MIDVVPLFVFLTVVFGLLVRFMQGEPEEESGVRVSKSTSKKASGNMSKYDEILCDSIRQMIRKIKEKDSVLGAYIEATVQLDLDENGETLEDFTYDNLNEDLEDVVVDLYKEMFLTSTSRLQTASFKELV